MEGFDLVVVPDPEDEDAALLFVDGTVCGRPYRFLLDTGAARTSVGTDEHTAAFAPVGTGGWSDLFGKEARTELVVVPSIELGPIARADVTVARTPAVGPAAGNLVGMDLLVAHRLHVRFDRRRVVVDPPREPGGEAHALTLDRANHPSKVTALLPGA